ncbi:hypothetical protein Tsubulata_014046 [Turnera subulata]|uniref:MADS-box domain-containing protein n=1 Tax=Turnera subulata TaxID=218843 RepID=A0A9Q0F0T2_9ROSI|nr:hypothetical protein Tsubulata_014046 [Turnera subulata]
MTRKKVELAFITNDAARKATFKKRKKGLMKQMDELTTLCGIEACAIVHSPYEAEPDTWPSPAGVQNVLEQFRQMPGMDQSKKMVNLEGFLRQRISKADEKLKKQCKDNREKEVTHAMFQILAAGDHQSSLQRLTMVDLSDLTWMIDHYLKDVTNRSDTLRNGGVPPLSLPLCLPTLPLSPPAPAQPLQVAPLAVVSSGEAGPSPVQQDVRPPPRPQQPQGDHQRPPASAAASSSMNVGNMQRQNWCMDFMSPLPHPLPPPTDQTLGFGGGDEMMMPFGDSSSNPNNAFW